MSYFMKKLFIPTRTESMFTAVLIVLVMGLGDNAWAIEKVSKKAKTSQSEVASDSLQEMPVASQKEKARKLRKSKVAEKKKAKTAETVMLLHTQRKKDEDTHEIYHSFNEGFLLMIRANFLASVTLPRIANADLAKLQHGDNTGGSVDSLGGGVGFVMDGEAEFGYIFGKDKWFANNKSKTFSGMGVSLTLGVGQHFSAMAFSGSYVDGTETKGVRLYFTSKSLPAITFGITHRLYFFSNRMAIGLWVGGKAIVDTSPEFYFYSADSNFPTTVGTLIITKEMLKKMNRVMFSMKGFIEYNQPIVRKMQLVLRLYAGYSIFKPNYIVLPKVVTDKKVFKDGEKLSSLFVDSMDVGLSVALAFKT